MLVTLLGGAVFGNTQVRSPVRSPAKLPGRRAEHALFMESIMYLMVDGRTPPHPLADAGPIRERCRRLNCQGSGVASQSQKWSQTAAQAIRDYQNRM